jgi:hypothetical protein
VGSARIADLSVGTCFDHPDLQGVIDGSVTEVQDVTVVPCETPHELEVIGRERAKNPDSPGGRTPYPGEDALTAQAEQLCTTSFDSYIGTPLDSSTLSGIYVFPSAEEWRDIRNQNVVCTAHTEDGSLLTGSVQGSER